MSGELLAAGAMVLVAAVVHGALGESRFLRRLDVPTLPSSWMGGPTATLAVFRIVWHLITVGWLVMGTALVACGGRAGGASCTGVGRVASASFAAFALTAVGGALAGHPRVLLRHPAWLLFVLVSALAWMGAS